MIYNGNATKKHHLIKPEKLFKLPQDNLKENKIRENLPTLEETRTFARKVANQKNKRVFKI